MAKSPMLESFLVNEKFGSIASHLLIALMMVCFAVSIQHLAERVVPGWHAGYVPWLAFLVAIEAMHSRREVRREADLITSRFIYRLIEWVVIALVVKLILVFNRGVDHLWAELSLWQDDFLIYFFDGEYIFVLLLTFIIWTISGGFSGHLMKLEGDKFLLEMDIEVGIFSDRTAVRRLLAGRIFSIGMLMVSFTALVRWDYQTLWGDRPVPTYNLWYVMLYFLFGYALITLTHFAARRAVWAMEQIPLSNTLSRQWLIYSILFLLGVTLLAFILPTGYSMGLLATLAYVLNFIFAAVAFLFYLLSLPIIFLLNLFFKLTDFGEPLDRLSPSEYTPLLPPQGGISPIPWWEVLRTILFWGLFLAITCYAFVIFLRQNQYLLGYFRKIPGWRYLVVFWQWLSSGFLRANQQTRSALRGILNKLRIPRVLATSLRTGGFVNPRRLSPRQQVLFLYLMMLRRGQESGMPRKPSQTPFEYEERLESDLPDVDVDLKSMTEAFVEARYSRHPITPDRARHVYSYWERIKRALRLHKKGQDEGIKLP
jgi:hypothetical protein